jgi:hypothetical protein
VTSPARTPSSPSRLVARWTRATFLGWSLGFALILLFIGLSGMVGLGDSQFPVGLGMGIGVGLLQRRVLAEYLGTGAGWLGASAAGMTAPFVARDIARLLALEIPYALAGSVVVGGLAVGLLEWRVLRRHVTGGASWVLASVFGWALAGSTVVLNDKVLPKIPGVVGALIYIAVILIGGVPLGVITGLVLQRLGSHAPRGTAA